MVKKFTLTTSTTLISIGVFFLTAAQDQYAQGNIELALGFGAIGGVLVGAGIYLLLREGDILLETLKTK